MSDRIGIAGLGLIGGSLLRGLAGGGLTVSGFDADAGVREAATAEGFEVAPSLEDLAARSDVVFAAVPPTVVAFTVGTVLHANDAVVVADATSFKQRVVADVAEAAPAALDRFVPAHPLAGAQGSGWGAARGDLLRGAVWAICPVGEDAPAGPLCSVAAALDEIDTRLLVCTAGEHDEAVARTSHVPHVAAQALVHLAGDGDVQLRAALSGGGYRDTTRVAASDPALWAEILVANREATGGALDALIAELQTLREAIDADDPERVAAAWQRGRELRSVVERVRWTPPDWSFERAEWPAWTRLLALGRAGRTVRRLRPAGEGAVEFEVAA